MITILEPRHEVWHESDQGDIAIAYFDVPLGSRFQWTTFQARMERGFKECITKWLAMREAEGWKPASMPELNPNAFYCLERGKEDYRRFYVAARWKRVRPELLPVDSAAAIAAVGHVDQQRQMREFFEQMKGLSGGDVTQIGRDLAEMQKLPEKAEQERRTLKEIEDRLNNRITL